MSFADLLEQSRISGKPSSRSVHTSDGAKALAIALASGVRLDEHVTRRTTTLIVLSGKVRYTEPDREIPLEPNHALPIPENVIHALVADEDAIVLLVLG